jgi:hypothetical protein
VVAGDAVLLDRHLVSVGQFTDTARGISRACESPLGRGRSRLTQVWLQYGLLKGSSGRLIPGSPRVQTLSISVGPAPIHIGRAGHGDGLNRTHIRKRWRDRLAQRVQYGRRRLLASLACACAWQPTASMPLSLPSPAACSRSGSAPPECPRRSRSVRRRSLRASAAAR